MAAKLIVVESTTTSTGTTTVYTVGSNKAARIRIGWQTEGGGSSKEFAVHVGAPAAQTIYAIPLNSEHETWTGALIATSAGSGTGTVTFLPSNVGIQDMGNVGWSGNTYNTDKQLVAALPLDWYLAAGDTVKYTISTTGIGQILFQVTGVEDDA